MCSDREDSAEKKERPLDEQGTPVSGEVVEAVTAGPGAETSDAPRGDWEGLSRDDRTVLIAQMLALMLGMSARRR